MNSELRKIIEEDIKRCDEHQQNEGSYELYQALMGKYNGVFPGFSDDIPQMGKVGGLGPSNYKPELNAIKEKLNLLLALDNEKDPLYEFKKMFEVDLENVKVAVSDKSNRDTPEVAKQELYSEVTAKYHPYITKFSKGLYEYYEQQEIYEIVSGKTLFFNLGQIYNKMLLFKTLGYPGLLEKTKETPATVFHITNTNENHNVNTVTFEGVRKQIENMSALPDREIDEILEKVNELEKIVSSKERKSKKWESAKGIIKWIADKGVDVGISLLPLLIQIQ